MTDPPIVFNYPDMSDESVCDGYLADIIALGDPWVSAIPGRLSVVPAGDPVCDLRVRGEGIVPGGAHIIVWGADEARSFCSALASGE
jgi:hypothetical protein